MAKRIASATEISDEELLKIGSANPNMRFELVEGELVAMTPVGGHSGELEAQISAVVINWCDKHSGRGFSPSTGFKLPNGNVRSPDSAVLLPFQIRQFPPFSKNSSAGRGDGTRLQTHYIVALSRKLPMGEAG